MLRLHFFPKILQGKYWLKNFQLDSKKVAPWAPEGLWRGDIVVFDQTGKELIFVQGIARTENGNKFG